MALLNARPHPVRGMDGGIASGSCPQIPERSLWKTFHVNVSQQKWQLAMHTSLVHPPDTSPHILVCIRRTGGVDVTNATCMTNQLPIRQITSICNRFRFAVCLIRLPLFTFRVLILLFCLTAVLWRIPFLSVLVALNNLLHQIKKGILLINKLEY